MDADTITRPVFWRSAIVFCFDLGGTFQGGREGPGPELDTRQPFDALGGG